jgi:NAD(P)-dependent dehydrogenase (short-subunit alcohol dehydrogenase family)
MKISQSCFSLENKLVILTGGTGLIGQEAVKQLPLYGAQVVVGVRDSAAFTKQMEDITYNQTVSPPVCYPLDIGREESIRAFFAKVFKDFGAVDILINNAFPRTADWQTKFEEVPAASLLKNLSDHAMGYFLCCQQAVTHMKSQQNGVILNIGSIYGEVGPHFNIYEGTSMTCPAAYSLIKGGIHTLTKYLATYLAPYHIRVNCLSPGGIRDENNQHPQFIRAYCRQTPWGRMGEPQDIIGPMIFLIAPASQYVTGMILFVDGGWTAW